MKVENTTVNQDLLQKTRQRAFFLALQELSEHKDISEEESSALINHHAISPMVFRALGGGWCSSKEEVFSLLLTELKTSLEQSRQTIQKIKDDLQPSSWDDDGEKIFKLSQKTISKLDDMDMSLQDLLNDCQEIDKRGR